MHHFCSIHGSLPSCYSMHTIYAPEGPRPLKTEQAGSLLLPCPPVGISNELQTCSVSMRYMYVRRLPAVVDTHDNHHVPTYQFLAPSNHRSRSDSSAQRDRFNPPKSNHLAARNLARGWFRHIRLALPPSRGQNNLNHTPHRVCCYKLQYSLAWADDVIAQP
jgi:hypothetical protein